MMMSLTLLPDSTVKQVAFTDLGAPESTPISGLLPPPKFCTDNNRNPQTKPHSDSSISSERAGPPLSCVAAPYLPHPWLPNITACSGDWSKDCLSFIHGSEIAQAK